MKSILLSGPTRDIITRTRLFIALNVADFVITVVMVNSGMGTEGNPLLSGSLFRMGFIKLAVTATVVLWMSSRTFVIRSLNICLGMVVLWNVVWMVLL